MSAIEVVTKSCFRCGIEKPASEFHIDNGHSDGLRSSCKDCTAAAARQWQADERERMGDEAFRAYQTEIVRRSRQNPEVRERGRRSQRAYNAALAKLRERHPAEFAGLLRIERYERGLS